MPTNNEVYYYVPIDKINDPNAVLSKPINAPPSAPYTPAPLPPQERKRSSGGGGGNRNRNTQTVVAPVEETKKTETTTQQIIKEQQQQKDLLFQNSQIQAEAKQRDANYSQYKSISPQTQRNLDIINSMSQSKIQAELNLYPSTQEVTSLGLINAFSNSKEIAESNVGVLERSGIDKPQINLLNVSPSSLNQKSNEVELKSKKYNSFVGNDKDSVFQKKSITSEFIFSPISSTAKTIDYLSGNLFDKPSKELEMNYPLFSKGVRAGVNVGDYFLSGAIVGSALRQGTKLNEYEFKDSIRKLNEKEFNVGIKQIGSGEKGSIFKVNTDRSIGKATQSQEFYIGTFKNEPKTEQKVIASLFEGNELKNFYKTTSIGETQSFKVLGGKSETRFQSPELFNLETKKFTETFGGEGKITAFGEGLKGVTSGGGVKLSKQFEGVQTGYGDVYLKFNEQDKIINFPIAGGVKELKSGGFATFDLGFKQKGITSKSFTIGEDGFKSNIKIKGFLTSKGFIDTSKQFGVQKGYSSFKGTGGKSNSLDIFNNQELKLDTKQMPFGTKTIAKQTGSFSLKSTGLPKYNTNSFSGAYAGLGLYEKTTEKQFGLPKNIFKQSDMQKGFNGLRLFQPSGQRIRNDQIVGVTQILDDDSFKDDQVIGNINSFKIDTGQQTNQRFSFGSGSGLSNPNINIPPITTFTPPPFLPSFQFGGEGIKKKKKKRKGGIKSTIAPSFTGIIGNFKISSPVKESKTFGVNPFSLRGLKGFKGNYSKII